MSKQHSKVKIKGGNKLVTVLNDGERIGLLKKSGLVKEGLVYEWSKDGIDFKADSKKINFYDIRRKKESLRDFLNYKISFNDGIYYLTTLIKEKKQYKYFIYYTKNLYDWYFLSELDADGKNNAVMVKLDKQNHVLYEDGLFFKCLHSDRLKKWENDNNLYFTSRAGMFDKHPVSIISADLTDLGITIIYDASFFDGMIWQVQAGVAITSKENPSNVIWRSEVPFWHGLVATKKTDNIKPLGATCLNDEYFMYWLSSDGSVLVSSVPAFFKTRAKRSVVKKILVKHSENPVLSPLEDSDWESEAVFNPAAIYDGSKVHLLYRAVGYKGISVLGYASSDDGLHFNKRLSEPVFVSSTVPTDIDIKKMKGPMSYNPPAYSSGGSWNGCEDPRAVKINKKIYVTYTAFGGWDSMRIAMTSISEKNFENGKWSWKKPLLISPSGERHKNWVLFPEKINGKFAVLHGIAPEIMIDYIDDLDKPNIIKSERKEGPQPGREEFWDNKIRGAGAPPLKTDLGWLLFYHATDSLDSNKYKIGAMILDKDDPKKILYRSSQPLLSPDMHYENDGKPGVVYVSGAIIKDEKIFIYYGGGDKHLCVATAPLKEFLADLKKDKQIVFNSEEINL